MSAANSTSRTKAAQREATLQALMDAARAAFAEHGYRQASLEAIAAGAGVTKGALYHHFRGGKQELFRAVAARLHMEIGERIASSAPDADAWEQLLVGCRTFLEATLEPAPQQILLLDAPAVLGWSVWRELDAVGSMRHLEEALQRLIEEEVIDDVPLRALVSLLSGAMNEAALGMAQLPDPERALEETVAVLGQLLVGLRRDDGPEAAASRLGHRETT